MHNIINIILNLLGIDMVDLLSIDTDEPSYAFSNHRKTINRSEKIGRGLSKKYMEWTLCLSEVQWPHAGPRQHRGLER